MLMDNLPRLRRQPIATKLAVYRKVGGHPKSIELLEGWLASGTVTDLLADPSLDGMLAQQWADYFLRALLAQLTAAERDALARLCIFETSLDQEAFDYAEIKPEWVRRWLDLSLVQRAGGGMPDIPAAMLPVWELLPESEKRKLAPPEAYTVHPVVRESLVGRMTKDERRRAHAWAAAFYGRPFVEMARSMVRPGVQVDEEQIEDFARSGQGVVGQMVARTDDLDQAHAAMGRSLAWHGHLFAAGEYEAASEIVTAVWQVLDRWGERDRAKALLRGCIETVESANKAVAQSNLATLLAEEGKLAEALATYEAVYRTFEALGAKQQMAAVLSTTAIIYLNQGNYDKAIEYEERSLALEKERENEEGQTISLHQLSILHLRKEDYAAALARSQEAEKLARKLNNEQFLAAMLHQQGLILIREARAAATGDEAATHRGQPSNASRPAWRSVGALGTRPAPASRWGNWASYGWTLGKCRRRSPHLPRILRSISVWDNPIKSASALNCWVPCTNARASSPPRWKSISRRWSWLASTTWLQCPLS